jgi:hypothetical protein
MSINVIQHDDRLRLYDRFTIEHFPLGQNMILTTSFFFARDSIVTTSCYKERFNFENTLYS